MTTHFVEFNKDPTLASKKLAWATDLHLDAADKANHRRFFDLMVSYKPDIILIGGDVSNGVNSLIHLKHLAKLIKAPFYFILGNHDFYYGSIKKIRALAHETSKEFGGVHYLTDAGIVELTPTTALIGHDGWYDGRSGDFMKSNILLNDYFLIDELKDLTLKDRLNLLNKLGSEAADYIKKTLQEAFKKYDRVIILTHAPPFREVCLYEGLPSNDNWAPHFVCKAMGDVLLEEAQNNPNKQILVLCGHTHAGMDASILPNLRVLTGQSELKIPHVQGIIKI